MKDQNKNLFYLHELSDYKVADDYADVRDWEVIDADKRTIGKVDGLLVNKAAERVVYLDVEVDASLIEAGHETYATHANEGVHEFLNQDGENHLIIPIGMVMLDEDNKKVYTNQIDYTTFANTKRFKKGVDVERSYELMVLPQYFRGNHFDAESSSENQFYNRKEFNHSSSSTHVKATKRSIKNLMGFTMGATDGEIGKVKDFYFDDVTWTIRYLVVETGSWLSNREVLISPEALLQSDWENEIFPVNLTKEQIEKSPNIDTDQPVSRQNEMDLYAYYPWTTYWGGGLWAGGMGTTGMMMPRSSMPMEEAVKNSLNTNDSEAKGDPHLRSVKGVQGYTIHAIDDTIGDVEDFIVDESDWTIQYMVVDTGNWFPGKNVIVSPGSIKEINWETSEVTVNASVEQIKNSPEFDASKQLSTE